MKTIFQTFKGTTDTDQKEMLLPPGVEPKNESTPIQSNDEEEEVLYPMGVKIEDE